MKPIEDSVVLIADYGSFTSLAELFARRCRKVYYNTPGQFEFHNLQESCKGDGLDNIERVESIISPETVKECDLFVFPDIGYTGEQLYLREIGKLVWGHGGMDQYELYRTRFLKLVKDMGLEVPKSETIYGLAKLREHLKEHKDKWVKINRWRANRETFYHKDYVHSQAKLDKMAVEFGGLQDYVIFVVQDPIKDAQEIGYDFLTVDGQWPESAFSGYESKNELYLGSLRKYRQLPKQVREINEALTPVLREFQYRNFIATEIRVKDGVPHYIDPTNRMPGQTGEQLTKTCKNLCEMILHGANGELLKPEWTAKYAAEATLHYHDNPEDCWKVLRVPEEVSPWCAFYHYCRTEDGLYHFPPHNTDEVGIVMGLGNTIEGAIDECKKNLKVLQDAGEPVESDVAKFMDLIKEINEAEEMGMEFSDETIPEPESVLAD